MNIVIDLRPLSGRVRTGVGEFGFGLVGTLLQAHCEHHYFLLCFNGQTCDEVKKLWGDKKNVTIIPIVWPPRLLHFSLVCFGWPKLDKLLVSSLKKSGQNPPDKIDWWFSPNLHFTVLSENIAHLLTIHDLSFELFKEFLSLPRRVWHWAIHPRREAGRAKKIIVPSESTKSDLVDMYKIHEDKISVVYPGVAPAVLEVNEEKIRAKYNLPENFLLFLGTIEPRKNIVGLIDAFNIFYRHHPDYNLVVAGAKGWKDKEILEKIKNTAGVKFLGFVPSEDKAALMSLAKLFVYPSWYEGFGFPILEAMKLGVPVITSNRSSLPEVAAGAAYLVNPLNIEELSDGMRTVIDNKVFRESLIEAGRARARDFVWGLAVEEFFKVINRTNN